MIKCVEKVKKHSDKIVIFYSSWCPYSRSAIDSAKKSNIPTKIYDIDSIPGNFDAIYKIFVERKEEVGFNPEHKTRPIIFMKGKFIGGYNELSKILKKN